MAGGAPEKWEEGSNFEESGGAGGGGGAGEQSKSRHHLALRNLEPDVRECYLLTPWGFIEPLLGIRSHTNGNPGKNFKNDLGARQRGQKLQYPS